MLLPLVISVRTRQFDDVFAHPDRQQAGSYTGPSASPTINGYIAIFNPRAPSLRRTGLELHLGLAKHQQIAEHHQHQPGECQRRPLIAFHHS